MLLFWRYKEIYMGYSMQEFSRIRDILQVNRLKYDYRIVDNVPNRGRFGSMGVNPKYEYTYYVYVHKNDFDRACNLMHDNRH